MKRTRIVSYAAVAAFTLTASLHAGESVVQGNMQADTVATDVIVAGIEGGVAQAGGISIIGTHSQGDLKSKDVLTNVVVGAYGKDARAQVGGIAMVDSTVQARVNEKTMATDGVVIAFGKGATASVGGVMITDSKVNGSINSTTLATNFLVFGIDGNAQLGGVVIRGNH